MTLARLLMQVPIEVRRAVMEAMADNAVAVTDLSRKNAVLQGEIDRLSPVFDAAMAYEAEVSIGMHVDFDLYHALFDACRKEREQTP